MPTPTGKRKEFLRRALGRWCKTILFSICVLCSSGLLNQTPDEKRETLALLMPHRTCSYANIFRRNLCCHRQCHCQASFYVQFSLLNRNMGTDMFLVYLTDVWLFKMRIFLKFSPIHNLMYIFS